MKHLLYIGNKLSMHGNTATSIETLGAYFESEGYKVTYASCKLNKLVRITHMIFKTLQQCRRADYVLIDTYSTQNFWFAFIISQLCRILRLKYITKLHGGNLPKRLITNPFLCNMIFNNAYKITAPSDYLFKEFEKKYSNNLLYIPNSIEINDYNFKNRASDILKILWVRSFCKIYNPKMAIKVLQIVKEKYSNATLCMVGPDKEHLINECKIYAQKLNVSVEFTGKLSKLDWIKLSENYTIFINTTHFDNTPVSVIEAMALGLPVVSTNVGGIPFVIEDKIQGILVNDNDAQTMAKEIINLFENDQIRSTIVTNARNKVVNYDWDIVKHKWFEILK